MTTFDTETPLEARQAFRARNVLGLTRPVLLVVTSAFDGHVETVRTFSGVEEAIECIACANTYPGEELATTRAIITREWRLHCDRDAEFSEFVWCRKAGPACSQRFAFFRTSSVAV